MQFPLLARNRYFFFFLLRPRLRIKVRRMKKWSPGNRYREYRECTHEAPNFRSEWVFQFVASNFLHDSRTTASQRSSSIHVPKSNTTAITSATMVIVIGRTIGQWTTGTTPATKARVAGATAIKLSWKIKRAALCDANWKKKKNLPRFLLF